MENISWPVSVEMVRSIAMLNPRLAYMLVRGHQLVPRAYNISVTFEDTAAQQQLRGRLSENMYQDGWIKDLRYTIRRPDMFAGSIFKSQSDYYNCLEPYIDVYIAIDGQDKYLITNNFTPLESVAKHANGPAGVNVLGNAWVVARDQNIFVDFQTQRDLDPDEVPYRVTLTIHMLELSGCDLRAVNYTEALCALRKMGMCPEGCPPARQP